MRLPNNVLFKGTTAIFDKEMMPKCDKVKRRCFTPIGANKPKSKGVTPIPLEAVDDDDFPRRSRSPSPDQRDDALDQNDGSPKHSPPRTPPRQQELPPAQRQPPPPLRKSGCERKIPVRPDNVYGDKWNPVDLH